MRYIIIATFVGTEPKKVISNVANQMGVHDGHRHKTMKTGGKSLPLCVFFVRTHCLRRKLSFGRPGGGGELHKLRTMYNCTCTNYECINIHAHLTHAHSGTTPKTTPGSLWSQCTSVEAESGWPHSVATCLPSAAMTVRPTWTLLRCTARRATLGRWWPVWRRVELERASSPAQSRPWTLTWAPVVALYQSRLAHSEIKNESKALFFAVALILCVCVYGCQCTACMFTYLARCYTSTLNFVCLWFLYICMCIIRLTCITFFPFEARWSLAVYIINMDLIMCMYLNITCWLNIAHLDITVESSVFLLCFALDKQF